MARYINADKLIEGRTENDPVVIAANCEPTANVQEVKHGEWIGYDTISSKDVDGCGNIKRERKYYRCSECRKGSAVKNRFCPNCGAEMDGGGSEK